MVLKGGYHRAFAVARAIMTGREASDVCFLAALAASPPLQLSAQFPAQGLRKIVLGPRPPLFADFFDDSLTLKV